MRLSSSLTKKMGTWALVGLLGACGGGGAPAPEPVAGPAAKSDQTVLFTSAPPTSAQVGGPTYEVSADAVPSGLPVTLSLGAGSAGCALNGSTVSFTGIGTCVIAADQPGNDRYNAAPRIQQSFAVIGQPYTIDQLSGPSTASYAAGYSAGQNFLVPTTARLERVEVYVQSTGTLWAELFAVGADGLPTGVALATSDTVPGAASAATATSFVFSTPVALGGNTRYAVVVTGTSAWGLQYSTTNVYAGGNGVQNSSGLWMAIPTADVKFQLFLKP